ncbi:centrosomal protein of 95 kDa-like isoform X5 [Siphateles boraxobius]|uniref:centrosomal protein of 95 kDa-like isoform X5 n=1 Tax=Siphateles boraxobius TaxID=180520 RepID=UPI004063ED46
MGSDEKDWVDVANNVLLKCHINLRLERISECDANVFVALYEAILGEKVPDCVAAERQEDDIHNVQSVIDSLALDYLQISLSHITGENVVRGEKESIRNLLEIFDGLLDYLIEQQSDEEPQLIGLNGKNSAATATLQPRNQDRDITQCQAFSIQSALQSNELSLYSWNGDEFKSTTELIKLRDSGCMFMAKQEVLPAVLPQVETLENAVSTQTTLLRESLWPTIHLQFPYQTTTRRPPSSPDMALFTEDQTIQQPENSCHKVDTRPILFCTQPGRHREIEEKEEREEEQANRTTEICVMHTDERQGAGQKSDGDSSLSLRSQRNKEAERELHDMSEKLSQRLEELDLMLKRALGEVGEMCEPEEEDKQSLHSERIMERRTPKNIGSCHARAHAHSLLDSLPPAQCSFQQDALIKEHSQLRHKNTQIPRSCIKSSCSRSSRTRLQQKARRETHSLRVKENNLLPILLDEFPQLEEAQKRHDMLMQIIRKEQEHSSRLRVFRERIQQQKFAQNKLREQRQQFARAKKYYSIYHIQLRANLMQAKTQEERNLKLIFEEGLERQKAHLREQRAYSKELLQENYRKYQDEIEAMENYYKDQFSLLAETLAHERQDIQIRTKAQEKALQKKKRELRSKMEKEIGELQKIIIQNDENNYFRDLEVERLRKHVQMASFQYTTR